MLRRLLLLPLLAPLLAVLIVAALNPRPATSLRLLTWRSPALPMGLWIALAGGGGALLSAGATALALSQASSIPLGRRLRSPGVGAEPWEPEAWQRQERWQEQQGWEAEERRRSPSRADERPVEPPAPPAGWDGAGGSRAPGEPAPTVSVPFRVVRRPAPAEAAAGPAGRAMAHEQEPQPVPVGDAWDSDWNGQAGDDW